MEEQLLAAILAEPHDDALRLVFADFLEERGECQRADFIRVQVELAKMPECLFLAKGEEKACYRTARPYSISCKSCLLKKQEEGILCKDGDIASLFSEHLPGIWHSWSWIPEIKVTKTSSNGTHRYDYVFRRGFVAEVSCSCDEWMKHGPEIVRRHPVEKVMLTDKECADSFGVCLWVKEGLGYTEEESQFIIPEEIFQKFSKYILGDSRSPFRTYNSESDALNDISQAALRWAKEK